jgi:hypothetical protein
MTPRDRRTRLAWAALGAPVVVAAVVGLGGCSDDNGDLEARQAEVARRGAEVMPFDLDATTHRFTKTDDGGVQLVTADDPDDAEQVALVRAHLAEEREKFARGEFDDPARIHGMDMPGVAELGAGYEDVTVTYRDRPTGAELTYRTTDPELVDAIHQWFDRQVMDHGEHAEG